MSNGIAENPAWVLANCLVAMADTLHTNADRLRALAGLIEVEVENGPAFAANVTSLLMSVFNTSSLVGPAQTALYAATQMAEG